MEQDKRWLGHVHFEIKEQLGVIEFYHPSHNSLPGTLLSELAAKVKLAGEDPTVRIILLKSAGERTFCAGASFDELVSIKTEIEGKSFFMGFARLINEMRKCPKFIIGRVQGKAVGGGVGIASAVDLCFATDFSSVKLSELEVGIGPFVVGPAVERKIGLSSFSQLAMDASAWKDASWARDKGLYAAIFTSIPELDHHITDLISRMSGYNPEAMRSLKRVLWEGTEHWDSLLEKRAEESGRLVLSDFSKRAIARFKK